MSIEVNRVLVDFTVKVPDEALEKHLPANPHLIGEEIASRVKDYVQKNQLGYYPALSFFAENSAIDMDLLRAVDNISWVASEIACNEIKFALRPVFSSIKFEAVQTLAYTIPKVRSGCQDELARLSQHYTPNTIKISLNTTNLQRSPIVPETSEKFAKGLIIRWLKARFDEVDINSVTFV